MSCYDRSSADVALARGPQAGGVVIRLPVSAQLGRSFGGGPFFDQKQRIHRRLALQDSTV